MPPGPDRQISGCRCVQILSKTMSFRLAVSGQEERVRTPKVHEILWGSVSAVCLPLSLSLSVCLVTYLPTCLPDSPPPCLATDLAS